MKRLKKLMQEFKAFITRGNVVDMAVAVIIGAAFGAIVTSLTENILRPLINWAVGGSDGIGLVTMLRTVYTQDADGAQIVDMVNSIYIDWGVFIMKIVDFLLIALVLFVIIKIFMTLKNATASVADKAKKKTAKMAKKLQKQGMSEEEALKQAEAQVAAEEIAAPAEPPKPTTDELLTEIRDLLAAQSKVSVDKSADSEEK